MASTVTIGSGYGIDTRDFKHVIKALRKAEPAIALEVTRALREAGQLVARDAKAIVSQYSTSIPPTIKVTVRGATVAVEAGGRSGKAKRARELHNLGYGSASSEKKRKGLETDVVAIAGLFELGNTGGAKSKASQVRGEFRHPVFGNMSNWVNQSTHPYLVPAGEKNKPAIEALVLKALDKVTALIVLGE